MPGTRFERPKSNAAFTSNRQRPQKKTCACLGKGLAYNAIVVDGTGEAFSRIDDPVAVAPRSCLRTPPKLLPFGGNAPDFSGAQKVFIMPGARGSTPLSITNRNDRHE
jgi:hypothetical protein